MSNDINGIGDRFRLVPEPASRRPDSAGSQEIAAGTATSQGRGESVELTDTANQLRTLADEIGTLPVVDTQRVESIRQSIADGSHRVDAERVAEKMIAFELHRSTGPSVDGE